MENIKYFFQIVLRRKVEITMSLRVIIMNEIKDIVITVLFGRKRINSFLPGGVLKGKSFQGLSKVKFQTLSMGKILFYFIYLNIECCVRTSHSNPFDDKFLKSIVWKRVSNRDLRNMLLSLGK